MYNDDYPTCARTYATLRIYSGDVDPATISEQLKIEPSYWQRRDEITPRPGRPPRVATLNGWFLESRNQVTSRDSRRHIDWLLDRVDSRAEAILSLQAIGCRMSVSCYWLSQSGQGGPTISPTQMSTLGKLNIELWFDIYGPVEDET